MTSRFVGIGINRYRHYRRLDTPATEVQAAARYLKARGFQTFVATTPDLDNQDAADSGDAEADVEFHPEENAVFELLDEAFLGSPGLPEEAAVVYWAGHGEKQNRGRLQLVAADTTKPPGSKALEPDKLADQLARSGYGQCLLIIDTCFSGTDVMEAINRVEGLIKGLRDDEEGPVWFGVIASAGPDQVAYDGVFASQLTRLLTHGPTDVSLRLRWNAYREGVRGDDVLDALYKEWAEPDHRPIYRDLGDPLVMIPNPNYDPNATAEVVEHLLLAATSTDREDQSSYFSGRDGPMRQLVEWVTEAGPGIGVITGPPGSGKSALAGRIVALSNEHQRPRLLEVDPPAAGTDPGQGSIAAHVHLRGLRSDDVTEELDTRLVAAGVLEPRAQPRNRGQLHGDIQASGHTPVIVLDGLDEAGDQAHQIADEVIQFLAEVATVIVATRHIITTDNQGDDNDLIDDLLIGHNRLIDLGTRTALDEERTAIGTYVQRRLDGISPTMDPDTVAGHVATLPREQGEGMFLLARLLTSRLAANPVNTTNPGWHEGLNLSVEEAFETDVRSVSIPGHDHNPAAAIDILTGLAFSYGSGLPDDLWPLFATNYSTSQAPKAVYTRDDVYSALELAGRYVSVRSEAGQATYRLTHQRLAEHLRSLRLTDLDQTERQALTLRHASALVDAYVGLLKQGTAARARPYLWSSTWRHCADAGPPGVEQLRRLADSEDEFRYDLALGLLKVADTAGATNRPFEAVAPTEEAVTIYRQLAEANPAFLNELASSLNNLGIRYSG
ncbi:MAG: hypothetical protein GY704_10100, partial [Phycisphaeraceae bacterium]|nr:hypothetical protein [Phycisphaeraceae bacterium]